ncbi:peptidylprolyl isomerase [Lacinutrix chionoecetis]
MAYLNNTMKLQHLLFFFVFNLVFFTQLQAQEEKILFTIDNQPVYVSEFLRVYNKNLDLVKEESQKDIDGYLELFINYKLKLKEAKQLELDQKPAYLREFESYKQQLSKNYLTDNKVTDALVEEAYNRLQTEINASHVLVRIDENASAQDTLAAYNEIVKLRNRVIDEGYKVVQTDVHNGRTIFAEDLGYFSAFKMVYPFESAAYNTNVGDVSNPFRTRFGYHVVKVLDKREAQGEVSVAHIMIKLNKDNPKESETKINEIHKRIQQGEAFDALAKQFSEDKSSSSNGGLLKPFSGGELSAPEFENVAFELKNIDDVSKPFKTQFGWHIVKLKAKKGIAAFEDMKSQLQSQVKRDSRSKVINDSRVNTLKSKYIIVDNKTDLEYFKSILNNEYYNGRWQLPANFNENNTLLKIEGKSITYNDFGQYLIKNQRGISNSVSINDIVESQYKKFVENELLKYQEENLINENEDYAQIVAEYRDGLLLFDLMETEIWNAAKTDSLAVKNYYQANKSSYFFPERVNAVVASSAKKNIIKKIASLMDKGTNIDDIKNLVNTTNQVNVSFTSGEMDREHQALPEDFVFKKGISKIYKHNDAYVVVKVNSVLPKSEKTLEEAMGKVTSDYQNFKEKNWLSELASKYKVEIYNNALNYVKKTIAK